jgi:hypothetical protein
MSDWQTAARDPIWIDHQNALVDFLRGYIAEYVAHSLDHHGSLPNPHPGTTPGLVRSRG